MIGQGKLFIVTAPSGAGKTSLVSALVEKSSITDSSRSLAVSVSHTTRPKRPNEIDGENYHFIDENSFLYMLKAGDFLEEAQVYGHRYGTSRQWVNQQLEQGVDVILEIDWQGAEQIKKIYLDCCYIFILPPSLEVLVKRLRDRAQDDQDTIEDRMKEAKSVMEHADDADYLVVNDNFNRALADIQAIIHAERLKIGTAINPFSASAKPVSRVTK